MPAEARALSKAALHRWEDGAQWLGPLRKQRAGRPRCLLGKSSPAPLARPSASSSPGHCPGFLVSCSGGSRRPGRQWLELEPVRSQTHLASARSARLLITNCMALGSPAHLKGLPSHLRGMAWGSGQLGDGTGLGNRVWRGVGHPWHSDGRARPAPSLLCPLTPHYVPNTAHRSPLHALALSQGRAVLAPFHR